MKLNQLARWTYLASGDQLKHQIVVLVVFEHLLHPWSPTAGICQQHREEPAKKFSCLKRMHPEIGLVRFEFE